MEWIRFHCTEVEHNEETKIGQKIVRLAPATRIGNEPVHLTGAPLWHEEFLDLPRRVPDSRKHIRPHFQLGESIRGQYPSTCRVSRSRFLPTRIGEVDGVAD